MDGNGGSKTIRPRMGRQKEDQEELYRPPWGLMSVDYRFPRFTRWAKNFRPSRDQKVIGQFE